MWYFIPVSLAGSDVSYLWRSGFETFSVGLINSQLEAVDVREVDAVWDAEDLVQRVLQAEKGQPVFTTNYWASGGLKKKLV